MWLDTVIQAHGWTGSEQQSARLRKAGWCVCDKASLSVSNLNGDCLYQGGKVGFGIKTFRSWKSCLLRSNSFSEMPSEDTGILFTPFHV